MSTSPPNPLPLYGQQSPPTGPPLQRSRADFEGQLRLLATFYTVLASLALLVCLAGAVAIPLFAVRAVHTTATDSNGTTVDAGGPRTSVGLPVLPLEFGVLVITALSCVLPFTVAHGLRRQKPWGRTLALVEGFLIILSFPIGTALGGYTFYVLLQSGARPAYAQLSQPQSANPLRPSYPGL